MWISGGLVATPSYEYAVTGFDSTYLQWVENGASPYLGAVDYPTNWIYQLEGGNKKEGNFSFADSTMAQQAETLTKVELSIRRYDEDSPDTGAPVLRAYVWDGSAWTYFDVPASLFAWAWKTVDITSVIDTWAKLDGCKIYLSVVVGPGGLSEVDAAKLIATTTVPSKKKPVGDGLTFAI